MAPRTSSVVRSAACRTRSRLPATAPSAATIRCTWAHRGRHGDQGHGGVGRRAVGAAAAGHRRHHPRLADAAAGRGAHAEVWSVAEILVRRWDCAPSCRASPPARVAAAPPAPPSRSWPSRSTTTCAARCRSGASATRVENLKVAVMGCIVNGPARASTPTSASACLALARRPRRRSSSTARRR